MTFKQASAKYTLRQWPAIFDPAVAFLFFFLLSLIIYFPALRGDFIWDDLTALINNSLIHSSNALFKIWFTKEGIDYWPVTYSLFRLEWLCFGKNPLGYHLVNLAIHALSCALLWRILLRLKLPYPFFVAFIFCIHPVNVESVAWIIQTKTTLSASLTLASTLFFLRYTDDARRRNYWLSVILFVLANLAKISSVTWPFIFLFYEWYRAGYQLKVKQIVRLSPFFLVSLILGLVNIFWYAHPTTLEAIRDDGLLGRLVGAGQIFGFYLYKAVLPLGLNFIYPRWKISVANIEAWIPSIILAFTLVLSLAYKKGRQSGLPLLLLYLLICLFPVMGSFDISFMRYAWVADHYLYLSLAGLIAAFVAYLSRIITAARVRIAAASLISLSFLFLSASRAGDYQDQNKIWSDTLNKNPTSYMAHLNFGKYLYDQNNLDEAIMHLKESLKLKPNLPEASLDLGDALLERRIPEEAIVQYQNALKIDPIFWQAHYQLGVVYSSQGKPEEAIYHFIECLKIKPDFSAAHKSLGKTLLDQKRNQEAIEQFKEAVYFAPGEAGPLYDLGTALLSLGYIQDAIQDLTDALSIDPTNFSARLNLGNAFLSQGKNQEAIEQYNQVLKIEPDSAEVYNNIGSALGRDKIQEATQYFAKAIKIKPDYADAHKNLGLAYIMTGNKKAALKEYDILKELNPNMAIALESYIRKN